MERRTFIRVLATATAGAMALAVDPERLLWTPGQRTYFFRPAAVLPDPWYVGVDIGSGPPYVAHSVTRDGKHFFFGRRWEPIWIRSVDNGAIWHDQEAVHREVAALFEREKAGGKLHFGAPVRAPYVSVSMGSLEPDRHKIISDDIVRTLRQIARHQGWERHRG